MLNLKQQIIQELLVPSGSMIIRGVMKDGRAIIIEFRETGVSAAKFWWRWREDTPAARTRLGAYLAAFAPGAPRPTVCPPIPWLGEEFALSKGAGMEMLEAHGVDVRGFEAAT